MNKLNEYLNDLNSNEDDLLVEDILECLGEDVTISEFLEFLGEAKRTSRTRITRTTKIKRAQSNMSTSMARKLNDPLYKRMKFFCEKCKEFRLKIHKKYGNRNKARARR